ncbi:VOC family protein [Streptomyces sp. NPDC051920]|uniref:VOC family protein n=1 Tax=Streptomyces sp. NPDC051920 TaxID=3155523 RepID=UPI00341AA9F7
MLTGIVIDALDAGRMDRFWRDAVQGRTGGLRLRFMPTVTPKPSSHKNRLHLDLAGGPDWEAEVARLVALGARPVDIGQGDVPWDVLADPEGNEFCVLRPGHPGVLSDAGLVAICLDVAEEDRHAQAAFWQSEAGWHAVEHHDWGVRLRHEPSSPVSLVMGPPAAPKTGRNRLRLEVTRPDAKPGEFLDAAGNEFHVRH